MPRGPNGQKRPTDTLANAILVAKVATGEAEEDFPQESQRQGGLKGGPARAENLSSEERSEIARKAANIRWSGGDGGTRTHKPPEG